MNRIRYMVNRIPGCRISCILGVLVLLFTALSCQKEVINQGEGSIRFVSSDLSTKAIIDGNDADQDNTIAKDALAGGRSFGVIGYRYRSNSWARTFDNVPVSPVAPLTEPAEWTYDNVQYWEFCPYRFFAYYPYDAAHKINPTSGYTIDASKCLESNEANVALTLTYEVPNTWSTTYTADQVDFMLATPKIVGVEDNNKIVNLEFKHALCQVGFRVNKTTDAGNLEIVDLHMKKLNSRGPATIKTDGTITWGTKSLPLQYSYNCLSTGLTIPQAPAYAAVPSMLLLPQGFNSTNVLSITVRDTTPGNSKTWTMTANMLDQLAKWEPGKRYIYTLTITPDPTILDTALEIAEWKDVKISVTI